MAQDSIDKILETRRQQAAPAAPQEAEGDKFYSVLGGDVVNDPLLEFRFRDGLKICFPYRDIIWLSHDPKGPAIQIDFGSMIINIKGRGLDGELFEGIRHRRVVWVKEADTEMQDHDQNPVFVEDIGFENSSAGEEKPAE